MKPQKVDVLVVTALKLERLAVREHLENVLVETESTLGADIGTSISSPAQRIAVIETGPGNVEAALLAVRAEELFRPEYIVMFGIAGGVKDVVIGDVVASRKVYWIEGGKTATKMFKARPDFAPVSSLLIQLARGVAADAVWRDRGRGYAGEWKGSQRRPEALVAPIVVGEKVVGSKGSPVAELIGQNYSDAVAVDMEDFGALRGGGAAERAKVIALRGISDLLSGKSEADKGGSQELAAANAAAFLFDLLDRLATGETGTGGTTGATGDAEGAIVAVAHEGRDRAAQVLAVGRQLYPAGPQQDGLWERAGGDSSRLHHNGPGSTKWWHAIQLIEKGGGGDISMDTLLARMRDDYPGNRALGDIG